MNMFPELGALQTSLDYHLQRHGVLASNLANADTPHYQPRDLAQDTPFEGALLEQTQAGHIQSNNASTPFQVETVTSERHVDGSSNDLERAMAQVTANRLRYETGLELAKRRIAMLRYAAADGSGA